MDRENLKPAPWEKAAALGDGTVRKFLAGQSSTLTDRTYQRLADAAAQMLGRDIDLSELQGGARLSGIVQTASETAQQSNHNIVSGVSFSTKSLVSAPQPLIVFLAVPGDGRRGNALIYKKKVGEVERPKFLEFAAEAFAFDVADDLMAPAFRTRDTLLVNPETAPSAGDDCIFVKAGSQDPMDVVGRHLVKASASTWTVRQHNPRKDVDLSRAEYPHAWPVVAIYKRR